MADETYTPAGRCRECGCTSAFGCWHDEIGGCSWVAADLCSACTPDAEPGWEHPPALDENGEVLADA